MNRVNYHIKIGAAILVVFSFGAYAEESKSPINLTIICSPGGSDSSSASLTDNQKYSGVRNIGGENKYIRIGPIDVDPTNPFIPLKPHSPGKGLDGLVQTLVFPGKLLGIDEQKQVKFTQDSINNTVTTVVNIVDDIKTTYFKAWSDIGEQAKRSFNDVVDAGVAISQFISSELKDQYALLQNAGNQLQQGKIIDAMWSTSIAPLHNTEDNFFRATQQSGILDAAVASAASIYGGPAGAAAYAAWKTFKATGDVNMAFRTGLLAAIQQQGGSIVNGMPTGSVSEVVKKAAIAGAAGGLAVAAAGGDEAAITDAFLKSSGNVLIQDARDKVNDIVSKNPNASTVAHTVGCISARNVSCIADTPYVKEQSGKLIDQTAPVLSDMKARVDEISGKWTSLRDEAERKANSAMTSIPKLIGSEAIPLLNNSIVITWTLGKTPDIKKSLPSVMITSIGDLAPFKSTTTYEQTSTSSK